MKNFIVKLIATGLGLGYSPVIPGTIGSLLGVAIFLVMKYLCHSLVCPVFIIVILFFIGVMTGTETEKLVGKKDPHLIVIDEVVGAIIFLYMVPFKLLYIITGFVIFRILDIVKPPPAWQSQRLSGGLGIMVDDLIVGLYTGLIIGVFVWLKNWF